jgi:hypothetical protein
MVLYHANGRVVIAHENYLEQKARKKALADGYVEQIHFCRHRTNTAPSNLPVRIIVDSQHFKTLYCWWKNGDRSDWEDIEGFRQYGDHDIMTDIDRKTLRRCSTFADEYFRNKPEQNRLHLPVRYPWQHVWNQRNMPSKDFQKDNPGRVAVTNKRHIYHADAQMAFIRPDEIERYVIPWLKKVQHSEAAQEKKNKKGKAPAVSCFKKRKWTSESDSMASPNEPLAMNIPTHLLGKIHLYNAMLQLGLPKFVQLPLIDAIVLEMYERKLSQCELDILEITIGRFYSRGIAVLDPVLNHLIGTYAFRTQDDRRQPQSPADARIPGEEALGNSSTNKSGKTDKRAHMKRADRTHEKIAEDGAEPEPEPVDFSKTKKKYLEYAEQEVDRGVYTDGTYTGGTYTGGTYLLPPELPVIAHSIKHWSGVRKNGSTAAAHTGFPLNVERYKKFTRRDGSTAIDVEEYVGYETNRLARKNQYKTRPGVKDIASVSTIDDSAPDPAGGGA